MALGHHIAGAALAAATLGSHTQLKLNIVKPHASVGMAGNVTVRDPAANTHNHDRHSSK